MAVPQSSPGRGLRDIRTMSDLLTETSNPQRKFLKLAMLAMERARRGRERESACKRTRDIDTRLSEIEGETKALMQIVTAEEDGDAPEARRDGPGLPVQKPRPGLKFKY